jgi:hypothetical protein
MNLKLEAAPDPFADLENLRLPQAFSETAGVKKLLKTVPVRKPSSQDFVRVHPELRLSPAALIELKDDREIYLVAPNMVSELSAEYFVATLYLTCTRQGVAFLWPVRLPTPEGKYLEWHRSAAEAAETAKSKWIRMTANMGLGAYELFEAVSVNIPPPAWPEVSFQEIIKVAFRDRLIDRADHPVVKRLRGEQ